MTEQRPGEWAEENLRLSTDQLYHLQGPRGPRGPDGVGGDIPTPEQVEQAAARIGRALSSAAAVYDRMGAIGREAADGFARFGTPAGVAFQRVEPSRTVRVSRKVGPQI